MSLASKSSQSILCIASFLRKDACCNVMLPKFEVWGCGGFAANLFPKKVLISSISKFPYHACFAFIHAG